MGWWDTSSTSNIFQHHGPLLGGPYMWEALAGFSKSFQYSEKQSCRHFKWGSLSDTLHCDKSAWRSLRPKQTSCIDPANGTWSAATCCNIEWLVSTPTDVLLKATVYGGNGAWKESDYRIGMNEAECHRPSNPARDLDLQYWLEWFILLWTTAWCSGENSASAPLLSCSPIEPNHQCARLRRRQAESPVRPHVLSLWWTENWHRSPVTILIHQIQNTLWWTYKKLLKMAIYSGFSH